MSIRDIRTGGVARTASVHRHNRSDIGHAHCRQRAMSRRQFVHTATGAAVIGAAFGAGLWRPGLVEAVGSHEPIPIPGGTPQLGGAFHLFGPTPDGSFDPIDAEPSTITDFNGFLGLTYISGTVTQTNIATGEVRTLPFVESDMRFMKGVFRGTDGRTHKGAFALV
jgi:hypothetical protein